jgi:hypothetical protein
MMQAIRQRVRVKTGGVIEVRSPELRPGDEADVIVVVENGAGPARRWKDLLGKGKGAFRTAQEADEFLRRERDSWA